MWITFLYSWDNKERKIMDASLLQKDNWYIIDNGLGKPVRARLIESAKQGRGFKNSVLMHVKGSDADLFDEDGSVYVKDIICHKGSELGKNYNFD